VLENAGEPGAHAAAAGEALAGGAERGEERVLDQIFRERRVAHALQRVEVERARVLLQRAAVEWLGHLSLP
jgi:hypothetical protein